GGTKNAKAKLTPFHSWVIHVEMQKIFPEFSSSTSLAGIAMLTHRQGFCVLDRPSLLSRGTQHCSEGKSLDSGGRFCHCNILKEMRGQEMRAVRIHRFGGPEVIVIDDIDRPTPGVGEVLVRVAASGVAPWDALIREGQSKVAPQPPLTLGSDLSGVIDAVGQDVADFTSGDEVYGVTNPQFVGANAEYATASAKMIARKPKRPTHNEAASVPVVAVTAWQMLFEYAHVTEAERILILGAAGNVGGYAVQLAAKRGLNITAIVRSRDMEYVRALGADVVLDSQAAVFHAIHPVDAVIDLIGGDTREKSFRAVKRG